MNNKIEKGNSIRNLILKKILNPTFVINYPYKIFEIKNLLPINFYQKLYDSFPSDDTLEKYSGSGNYYLKQDNKFFLSFLEKNPVWKTVYYSFSNQNFIRNAYRFSLYHSIKSRGISGLKIWSLHNKSFLRKIFRKTFVQFIIKRDEEESPLNPHTDTREKRLSMVFYISKKVWTDEDGGHTLFWKNKSNFNEWKNWNNVHLKADQMQNFENENFIFHKSIFEPNKLIGFIKNNISWHSIEKIANTAPETRKKIVINIMENYK